MDIFQQPTSQSVYIPNEGTNYQTQNISSPIKMEDILAQSAQENSAYNYGNITPYETTNEYPATNYTNYNTTQTTNETYSFDNIAGNTNTTYNTVPETYANYETTNQNINYTSENDININTNTYTTTDIAAYPATDYSNNNIISSNEAYPTTNYETTNNYEIQDVSPLNNNAYYENATPAVEYQNEAYDTGSYNAPNYSTMSTPLSTPQYEKFYSKIPLGRSGYKVTTHYVQKNPTLTNSALRASGFYVFPPTQGENPRRSMLASSRIHVEPIREDDVVVPQIQGGQYV